MNHACGRGLKYLGTTSGVDGVNFCVKSTEGTYWASPRGGAMQEYGRGRLGFGDTLPAFLRHQSFFVRCGPAKLYRPGGKDFTRLPPENATSIEGGLLFPEIFQDDYFELNTMNPVLQELYTNMLKYWISEADIDGYRLTAASHVTADFTAYLSTHLRFYASALGKKNFFIVGEVNQAITPFGGSYLGPMQGKQGLAVLPAKVQGAMTELCPSLALRPMILRCVRLHNMIIYIFYILYSMILYDSVRLYVSASRYSSSAIGLPCRFHEARAYVSLS